MANLPESSTFDAGVYQLELTDPVIGGPSGVSNTPLKNLANRTKYLKDHVDALESSRAPLDSPALTGAPTAPTAAAGTNTTQLATTAFVKGAVDTGVSGLAPLASPALTGTPTAPTAAAGTNTTQVATTAFVNAEIAADRPFEATATNIKMNGTQAVGTLASVARGDHVHPTDTTRAPLASPGFTGTPTAPTATAGTNTTQIATTAFVKTAVDNSVSGFAPIASPTFTGNPAAPTPAYFDQDTSLATTEFVQRALGNFRTYTGLSGNNTLAISEAGAFFEITSGSTGTTTLPSAVNRAGVSFFFNNTSGYPQTIAATSPSLIYGAGASGASAFSIPSGTQYEFISDGSNWKIINYGGIFSFGSSGYQKLPSGLIIQWGYVSSISSGSYQNISLNVTFPTACACVIAGSSASGGAYAFSADVVSTSVIKVLQQAGGAIPVRWLAIGY